MRTIRLFGLFTALGFLAGCNGDDENFPGRGSDAHEIFELVTMELYPGAHVLTPAQVLEVLEQTADTLSPGSHAHLNAAAVALDKGEDDKAIDHIQQFRAKVEKESGKKFDENDAVFLDFIAEIIIDEISDRGGG